MFTPMFATLKLINGGFEWILVCTEAGLNRLLDRAVNDHYVVGLEVQ